MKDIGDHPERAKNLHFSFVVLLRAVRKANSEGATVVVFFRQSFTLKSKRPPRLLYVGDTELLKKYQLLVSFSPVCINARCKKLSLFCHANPIVSEISVTFLRHLRVCYPFGIHSEMIVPNLANWEMAAPFRQHHFCRATLSTPVTTKRIERPRPGPCSGREAVAETAVQTAHQMLFPMRTTEGTPNMT